VLAIVAPAVLLILWQVGVWVGYIDSRFFGSPVTVVTTGSALIADGQLIGHIRDSVYRMLAGYVLGAGCGVLVGLLLGQIRTLRVAFEPLIDALYVVPKLSFLPILLLLIPGRELPIILLVAVSTFFVVALGSLSAALMTPPGYIDVANSFGASRWFMFWRVVFPSSLPQVFGSLRLASGAAVLMLVGAEFVVGNSGVGYLVWHSWSLFLASQMYVGIVVIALLGVIFTALVTWTEGRIIPWAHRGGFQDGE
jgi:NitT/TauT family transport system permease protein/sulfonate transport system permease protein